jgi:integrase/recombinase XerD
MKLKKIIRYLEWEDVQKVLNSIKKPRDKLLFRTMCHTGLRASEVLGLKPVDLDFNEGFLSVIGKGSKFRRIPVDSETLKQLHAHIYNNLRNQPNERIFKITRQDLFYLVRKWGSIVSRNDLHPHELRHTFAVHFVKNGGDIRMLQQILGHSKLETTSIYLQFKTKDLKQAYSKVFENSL